jgi:arylsulfatase A-like enzyme
VEAIDVYPTLVDLAMGHTVPSDIDGVSLRPLIENTTAVVKPAAYSEFVRWTIR